METKMILDTYKRYLETFKDKDTDLFTNYEKMRDFIDTNCDNNLWLTLTCHCIGKNVREIEERGFKVKDQCPNGWDASVTKKGYQLIRNIEKHKEDSDLSTYAINFHRFVDLANKQNPYLQLYLWYCFNKLDNRLLGITLKEVEEEAKRLIMIEGLKECETAIDVSSETEDEGNSERQTETSCTSMEAEVIATESNAQTLQGD